MSYEDLPPDVVAVLDDPDRAADWDEEFAALTALAVAEADDASLAGDAVTAQDPEAHRIVTGLAAARRSECLSLWEQLQAVAQLWILWSSSAGSGWTSAGAVRDAERVGRRVLDLQELTDPFVVSEITLACRVSTTTAWARLEAAKTLLIEQRLPRTTALLAVGMVDWAHLVEVLRATRPLDAAAAERVEAAAAAALAPEEDLGSVTVPVLRRTLAQAVAAVDAQAVLDRALEERARRTVRTRSTPEVPGMGEIWVYAPAEAVAAVAAGLDAAVSAARATGDPRTAGQIRCDELVARVTQGAWTSAVTPIPAEAGTGDAAAPTGGPPPVPTGAPGEGGPRLSVLVTIPLQTWAGLADDPARLEGFGPLPAPLARGLVRAMSGRATWRCAVLDPDSGAVLGLGPPGPVPRDGTAGGPAPGTGHATAGGYRPTPRQVDFVVTTRPTCSMPGCSLPAARCDVDHAVPYPDGPTCVCNLQPLCRGHHLLKTTGLLTVERTEGSESTADTSGTAGSGTGDRTWTTRAGQTAVSGPARYALPARPPGAPALRIRDPGHPDRAHVDHGPSAAEEGAPF